MMKLLTTLGLFGLGAVAVALPAASPQLEAAESPPCYPATMKKGQAFTECPGKKFTVDKKSGHCYDGQEARNECFGFCEHKLIAIYGPEVPIRQGVCQNGTTCAVALGETVTITNTYTVSLNFHLGTKRDEYSLIERQAPASAAPGLTGAIDIGASYSYSKSVAYSVTTTQTKELDAKTCGYWTFIPYFMKSCGTMSHSEMVILTVGGNLMRSCPLEKPTHSEPNYCSTVPYKNKDGAADGEIVFVYVDCNTQQVKKNGQASAYNWPGVAAWTSKPANTGATLEEVQKGFEDNAAEEAKKKAAAEKIGKMMENLGEVWKKVKTAKQSTA